MSLGYIIIFLIVVLYLQHYTYTRKDFKILQVYLDNVTSSQLYEKYPLLIYDRVVEPEKLLGSLFKYLYVSTTFLVLKGGANVYCTPFKYCMLYSPLEDIDLQLMLPSNAKQFMFKPEKGVWRSQELIETKMVQYVTIKLKKQQVLVLPPYWLFQTASPIRAICLHDPVSKLVDLFYTRIRTSR